MNNTKSENTAFYNSPLFLLIVGFFLTTFAGTYISHSFNEDSWKSKAKFEIFSKRLKQAIEFQNEILSISNERVFYLRRINIELREQRLQEARDIWKSYFQVVRTWNNNVKSNKNKIEILFGKKMSTLFLDYEENHIDTPKSLHHALRKSHESTLALIECMKKGCSESKLHDCSKKSNADLNKLGTLHDEFSMALQKALNKKEIELFSQ